MLGKRNPAPGPFTFVLQGSGQRGAHNTRLHLNPGRCHFRALVVERFASTDR